MTNPIWIKDHITGYDLITCPHCGQEAQIMDFSLRRCCPFCFQFITQAELSLAIAKAALTQVTDYGDIPEKIQVSEEAARQILGEAEYHRRKSRES